MFNAYFLFRNKPLRFCVLVCSSIIYCRPPRKYCCCYHSTIPHSTKPKTMIICCLSIFIYLCAYIYYLFVYQPACATNVSVLRLGEKKRRENFLYTLAF